MCMHEWTLTRSALRPAADEEEPCLLLDRRVDPWTWNWGEHGHLQHGGLAGPAVAAHHGSGAEAHSGLCGALRKFRSSILLSVVFRNSEADHGCLFRYNAIHFWRSGGRAKLAEWPYRRRYNPTGSDGLRGRRFLFIAGYFPRSGPTHFEHGRQGRGSGPDCRPELQLLADSLRRRRHDGWESRC